MTSTPQSGEALGQSREALGLPTFKEHHQPSPGEIAIGVIIGRTSEFFDFFVYAIASVLVFPKLFFPFVDALTGTIYSFAIFALAFVARPFGSLVFMAIDRAYGRGTKLTIALFMLGGSTAAIAFLPSYQTAGSTAITLLCLFRLGQGFALGGTWDGLASLLALNAPEGKRGWYAMIPQLGAPFGLIVASALFAFMIATLPPRTSSTGAGAIPSSWPSRSTSWRSSRAFASSSRTSSKTSSSAATCSPPPCPARSAANGARS